MIPDESSFANFLAFNKAKGKLLSPEGIANLMRSCETEKEWNAHCDAVKKAHNGDYPPFWYEAIIASGIAAEAEKKFRKSK